MAGLCTPLPTLRRRPCGRLRTARGQCGSLLLHRKGLPPSTPCRSPGALRNPSQKLTHASQQNDVLEFLVLHSSNASAPSIIPGGISSPSALAVLRLTTISSLVGCSTGRSAGFNPFRILS